jgi:hypothetical protein
MLGGEIYYRVIGRPWGPAADLYYRAIGRPWGPAADFIVTVHSLSAVTTGRRPGPPASSRSHSRIQV